MKTSIKMKKIYSIILGCVAGFALVSCSDDSYTSKYDDPSKTKVVSCDKVLTGVFKAGNTWLNPIYYRYYVQSTTSGMFSQVIGSTNSRGRYMGAGTGYYNTRWQDFYDMLSQYRLLEKTYNELDPGNQELNKLYLIIGRSVMQQQLSEMLSLFGSLPYSQASTLWYTGDYAGSKPAYDKDTDLYKTILDDLKDANNYLQTGNIKSSTIAQLAIQDFVNKGDLTLWRKYINSLRLRVALHLASNGELAATAQAAIQEMLTDPDTYPMVDNNNEMTTVSPDNDKLNFQDEINRAIENSSYNRASGAMMRALNVSADGSYENADPRLPVLYDPNPDDKYIGLDPSERLSDQDANTSYIYQGSTAKYYAALDTATFTRNSGLPGLWMSAAEVSFGKAEAYAMGWAGSVNATKAKEAFIEGMIQSTDFYYQLNSTGTYRKAISKPSDAVIRAYAESQWNESNMQKCIITQKWVNFGMYNELEAWNCVRRTGYPELQFKRDLTSVDTPIVPNRLKYASDEVNYNTANYNAATNNGSTDTWSAKLFWMKDTWYTEIAGE